MTDPIPLRFGVVVGRAESGAAWTAAARRIEEQGFDILLVPDTAWTPSPFPALAAAAAVTGRLRLATWVLASPFRTTGALVREVAALQHLADGRFELGLGTGRPGAEEDARRLGVAWGSPAERLSQLLDAVQAVRAGVAPVPEVTIAASGPRSLAAAGEVADTVALALPPTATVADVQVAAARVREAGGAPALALQLSGVGGRWIDWLARSTPPDEVAARSAAFLRGAAAAMAEQLTALAAATGVTTFPVAQEHADAFAPVLALLR